MIQAADLSNYFKNIPRTFNFTANGVLYKCNKYCLVSFSSTLSKLISANPSAFDLKIEIPEAANDHIKVVIDFFHGNEFEPKDDEIFDYYYISSFLGTEIITNRLFSKMTSIISSDNVRLIYNRMSNFPDFCDPIIRFINSNPNIFNDFIKENLFHSVFIHLLLQNAVNMFENEDSKLSFLIDFFAKNDKHDTTTLDYSLYQHIAPEKLSNNQLNTFLHLPQKVSQNSKCFKLLSSLLARKYKLTETLNNLNEKVSQIQSELIREKNKHYSDKKEVTESSSQINKIVQTEEQIRARSQQLADHIEFLAADVALIGVQNEPTLQFMKSIANMRQSCIDMHSLMKSFYDNGGWFLWPGSSVSTLSYSKDLDRAMDELCGLMKGFEPNPELLCLFSQYFVNISDDIRKALK